MNIIADLIQTLFVFISEIHVCLQVTNWQLYATTLVTACLHFPAWLFNVGCSRIVADNSNQYKYKLHYDADFWF